MEREGREERGRGRKGEKMRKIISVMIILLMMGCNSRVAELEKKNEFLESIANLGKGFLDVFVSFGDMISGAFGIKADTKKSEVGKYFTDIATTMEKVKKKLNDEVAKNGQYAKVKEVVDEFITGTLDKIASGAREAAKGATGDIAIGGATNSGQDAVAADATSVNLLVKGIKEIVGVVLKKDEGDAGATKTGDNNKVAGKLLGSKSSDGLEAQAAAASASIGAVSGADILRAIASSGETASEPGVETAKNAAEIAAAKKEDTKEIKIDSAKKDAVIAGGIALRGMAKDGKLAAKNDAKDANAVNGVSASAVGKVLSTLIVAIRDTVDSGLKKIKEELGKVKEEDKFEAIANPAESTASVSVQQK